MTICGIIPVAEAPFTGASFYLRLTQYTENMEHNTNIDEGKIKLIIDNALLEQEKRITKSLGDKLDLQNSSYMEYIVGTTKDVAELRTKLQSTRWIAATVASAFGVLSGLLGFLVSQLAGK